jgi:hypothetical protein
VADTGPTSTPAATRALIRRLQADVVPVRRLWSPVARFGLWLILVALVGGTLGLSGLRPDLLRQLRDLAMLLEIALLASAGMAAAILALRAAVPGREASRFAPLVPLGLALATVGLWCRLPMQGDVAVSSFVARGLGCATRTLLLAALPWCALLIAVRRGAPPDPAKAGALIGGAALVMAALLMRFRCPLDERLHLLVWHALPVVGGMLLSAVAGLACLRSWRGRRPVRGAAREGWRSDS